MGNGLHCFGLRRGLLRVGGVWLALRVVYWGVSFSLHCSTNTVFMLRARAIAAYRTTFNGIMRVYVPCLLFTRCVSRSRVVGHEQKERLGGRPLVVSLFRAGLEG